MIAALSAENANLRAQPLEAEAELIVQLVISLIEPLLLALPAGRLVEPGE